jgi:glycosyltransferase involved in cell wall biosynthesis
MSAEQGRVAPFFSIVIPMFNRAGCVGRAIDSCLRQADSDFEIIVVDDGSTDGSADVVRAYTDERITLLSHGRNRGVSPARNTGVDAAAAPWIICLDSDDELLPDALDVVRRRMEAVGDEVGALRFMVLYDTGELSPTPPLREERWDYGGYIRWAESCFGGRQETISVYRRSTFATVRFPDDRSFEALYHLDFASRFITVACPEAARLYHHDAGNQLMRPTVNDLLANAADHAKSIETLLQRHGGALRSWAPRIYAQQLGGLATLHFLAGDRGGGLRALRRAPLSPRAIVVAVAGLLGARPLAWLKTSPWRGQGAAR